MLRSEDLNRISVRLFRFKVNLPLLNVPLSRSIDFL